MDLISRAAKRGSPGIFIQCQGGNGGDGLVLNGPFASAQAQDALIEGGAGGIGTCGNGLPGEAVVAPPGRVLV